MSFRSLFDIPEFVPLTDKEMEEFCEEHPEWDEEWEYLAEQQLELVSEYLDKNMDSSTIRIDTPTLKKVLGNIEDIRNDCIAVTAFLNDNDDLTPLEKMAVLEYRFMTDIVWTVESNLWKYTPSEQASLKKKLDVYEDAANKFIREASGKGGNIIMEDYLYDILSNDLSDYKKRIKNEMR